MKLIELSKNGRKHKGKYLAMVDDEDYEYLNQWNWHVNKCPNTCYASRNEGAPTQRNVSMQREVMKGVDSKLRIDHKDRNGLNNQKSNLRLATVAENGRNRASKRTATSKYLGVSLHRVKRKRSNGEYRTNLYWSAYATLNGENIYIGSYKSETEAALKYNEFAKKHYGEFANLNII